MDMIWANANPNPNPTPTWTSTLYAATGDLCRHGAASHSFVVLGLDQLQGGHRLALMRDCSILTQLCGGPGRGSTP
jgi:hypothetical protein